jgi:hypothetical protein
LRGKFPPLRRPRRDMRHCILLSIALLATQAAGAQDLDLPHPAGRQNNRFVSIAGGLAAQTRSTARDLATFRDPNWTVLTLAQIAAAGADTKTTLDNFHRCPGCFESGYSRYFIGNRPDAHKYILAGIVEIGVEAVAAHYFHYHGPTRKWYWRFVWTLPQTFSLYGHTQASFHNVGLRLTCDRTGMNCY